MTVKRDLKRRVRERQASTGESYTTALRRVEAQRPGRFPVVELIDITQEAEALGLRCNFLIFPALSERIDPRRALARLRAALVGAEDDAALEKLRAVALLGERQRWEGNTVVEEGKRFLARARAGVGGVSQSGRLLALPVESKEGLEIIVFLVWWESESSTRVPTMILTGMDGVSVDPILGMKR